MVGWFGAWRGKADHFATFQNGVKRACLQGISSPFCCADSAHCGPLSFLGRADVCKATKATNNNKIKHLLSSFTSFAFVCCLITPTQTTQHTHSLTHAHGLTHAHTRTHIMSQNAAHGMATAEVAHNTASDGKPVKKKQPKHKASPPNADQLKQQQRRHLVGGWPRAHWRLARSLCLTLLLRCRRRRYGRRSHRAGHCTPTARAASAGALCKGVFNLCPRK